LMRKGLTLVELIFTIVIIAMVFTVVPKIVLSLNKADSFVIRQDAMFNGISMMKMISNMPWDKENVDSSYILSTGSLNEYFDCNKTTSYRKGVFVGSRICKEDLNASTINVVPHVEDEIYSLNDIGNFNNTDINASHYGLHVEVKYINDDINYTNQTAVINIDKGSSISGTTNLKYVDINVTYQGNRGKKGKQLTQFNYTSANIGQMILHKRVWK